MKIVFTGGGSGGHFYPIISVAQELHNIASENKLLEQKFYFFSHEPYDKGLLFDNQIEFVRIPAGKKRLYFSIKNYTDKIKMLWGVLVAIVKLYQIFPDAVFAKGGFASFPTILAARILGIPVVIHESDAYPGRVNRWAAKFAKRIAVSYPQSAKFLPKKQKENIAFTGNPIRKELTSPLSNGAHEFLNLDPKIPTILVLGGSSGSQIINEAIVSALPTLLPKYQIIHQVGVQNKKDIENILEVILKDNPHKDRYKYFGYLDVLGLRMSAGVSSVIISRAGSTIFEIASWGVPSIIIPITNSNGDHQRRNAFAYAETGACVVIEEKNLTSHIIASEIQRITDTEVLNAQMRKSTEAFRKPDAAEKIAKEILRISLSHEE
jgi:UDP-N-acetylglucosamine--N-acetylmuramyl-(pentapeptide) pyrophosphoryl-undecaprenol N-acetylglucosamine transferase